MTARTLRDEKIVATAPSRSRAAWIVPMIVGVLTAGLVVWSAWPTLRPARSVVVEQAIFDRSFDQPPIDGAVATNGQTGSGKTVQAAGWLEAEPFSVASSALADGVVESIEALEGDRVNRGDIIAHLVADDSKLRLAAAESSLAGAKAELARAEAEFRAARTDWEHPVELNRAVNAGRAAVEEIQAEISRLTSLVAEERADLVRLEEEYSRVAESESRGVATDIELIIARQRVEAQRAALESAVALGPLLKARGDRSQADLQAAEQTLELRVSDRRRFDAARADVLGAEAGVALATVARDVAALELERMVIRAPIDGYVQRRYKARGDKVVRMMDDPTSAQIALIYDPSRIQVRVDVSLADASHLAVGQHCEVVVEVLPDRTFQGEVLRITHEADLQKNTLEVKVRVLDPSPILRPEMLTRVKFLARTPSVKPALSGVVRTSAMLVPSDALSSIGVRKGVWTVRQRRGDRGVVRPVEVEVLGNEGALTRVLGKLNPGDLLVLQGDGLSPGDRVRITARRDGGGP